MPNSLLVYFDKNPFVVLLIPELSCKSTNEILSDYAKWGCHDIERLSGKWITTVDITSEYPDRKPNCKGEWPKSE